MASKLAVVLCLVLASLQLRVNAEHIALGSSPLAQRTLGAQRTLDSLSPRCSTSATELILSEETRVRQVLEDCSKRAIFFQVSELLTDTAYFGFNLYNHGVTLLADFKVCSKEKCVLEKLLCALEKAPGATKSAVELAVGAISYALQVKDFLPKIIREIKECRNSSVTEYQHFLDGVLRKAAMC